MGFQGFQTVADGGRRKLHLTRRSRNTALVGNGVKQGELVVDSGIHDVIFQFN